MVENEDTNTGTTETDIEGAAAPIADETSTRPKRRRASSRRAKSAEGDEAHPDLAAEPEVEQPEAEAPASTQPDAPSEPATSLESETSVDVAAPQASRRPSLQVLFQAPPPLPAAAGPQLPDEQHTDDEDDEESPLGASSRSRRRTRRRGTSGTQTGEAADAQPTTEVVVKARPQQQQKVLVTEPQKLKGSTRLEAKRQRRRDGRDAGRRRTVITEAEFLARREAVDRVMVVRDIEDRTEIGVLEDGVLAEHYVAKQQNVSLIGNVYLGRVQNVLPSMEAAFVDIGRGRNAVLYSGEVDWEAASDRLGEKGNQSRKIELALKSGDRVLVQVTKDPIGHKGARLTSSVSLPGRYLVYVPNGSMNGISRKLPDTERARLKRILKDALPDSAGVIVRTAAEGATEEQLTVDVQRLANQWEEISRLVESATAPALLHSEPDLLVKIVRDVFNEDFAKVIISGAQGKATIERYLEQVAPELQERVEAWEGTGDVFAHFRVLEQIEKALDRKVWLPSGGSLVIDRTEAMTVIDVNTGKFVGSGGNLEETVTKNNLEAAEEIVRQLRLRDIGGIIVIDFIDMVLENNRDLVLRRLVECLSRDRTKHQVAEVTSLGLVQMTRKRLGIGLAESVGDAPAAIESRPEPQGRRRRGGNGGGQQQQPVAPKAAVAPHAITEGAKTALAQIAGATIVRHADGSEHVRHADGSLHATEPAEVAAAPAEAAAAPAEPVAPAASAEPAAPAHPPVIDTVPAGADHPDSLLGLPIVHEDAPRRIDRDAAASLLDSVLGALPEPKRPGQGRNRSRRVSTAALTPEQVPLPRD